MITDTLTEQSVTDLLKHTRNRRLQYLCRAYLQFGPEHMGASQLDEIRKAIGKRCAR